MLTGHMERKLSLSEKSSIVIKNFNRFAIIPFRFERYEVKKRKVKAIYRKTQVGSGGSKGSVEDTATIMLNQSYE